MTGHSHTGKSPKSPSGNPPDPNAISSTIAENITAVLERIRLAEKNAGRNPFEVNLLAVSKTKPASAIECAWQAGQRAFGENYLQEALVKIQDLQALDIEWHFIGALQSNKTRPIAEHFDWVHTLASEKHARRLSDQRAEKPGPLNCCIQVNIDHEASKAGVDENVVFALADSIAQLPGLQLRGLMCIPKADANETEKKRSFEKMSQLFMELQQRHNSVDTLSMGMSGDLEQAVAHGSTLVRVGTDIFGARE